MPDCAKVFGIVLLSFVVGVPLITVGMIVVFTAGMNLAHSMGLVM